MGEKLENAPIYFAIAQVRHNAILSIRDYLPAVQEGMRKANYPDFAPTFTVAFNFPAATSEEQAKPTPQQIERYVFSNLGKTRGFILEPNAFSFQSTEFESYEEFSGEFFRGLEIIDKIVGLSFSDRLGLRYLDAVCPLSNDEELWSYLVPGVLGLERHLPKALDNVAHSFSETLIITSAGNVTARVIIRNAALGFPMDLQPLGLQVADRFTRVSGPHAILDTDAAWQIREEFDVALLRRRLGELHEKSESVFDATVTEHAKAAWRRK
jgi:uncharacterized protein (TIGR04255 family)